MDKTGDRSSAGGRPGRGRSLVALRLDTGRTHQIRVHLAHLGCPLVGDFLYGEETEELPDRFALHSAAIWLRQPITGEGIVRRSPLPEAWRGCWGPGRGWGLP